MGPLPPAAFWIAVEFAAALLLLAAWWAWNTWRLNRRYSALHGQVEAHLRQVAAATRRVTQASRRLHGEVERLFADPADVAGLERLGLIRSLLKDQKESLEQALAGPLTAEALLTRALPAIDRAVAGFEEDLLTLLRLWDGALTEAGSQQGSPPGVATVLADAVERSSAELAALRDEHEALKSAHASLVEARQQSGARIRELEAELARQGAQEAERTASAAATAAARKQAQAELQELKDAYQQRFEKMRGQIKELREALEVASGEIEKLAQSRVATPATPAAAPRERGAESTPQADLVDSYTQLLEQQNRDQDAALQRQGQELRDLQAALAAANEENALLKKRLQKS